MTSRDLEALLGHADPTLRALAEELLEVRRVLREKALADKAVCNHQHSLFYYCYETDGRRASAQQAVDALAARVAAEDGEGR